MRWAMCLLCGMRLCLHWLPTGRQAAEGARVPHGRERECAQRSAAGDDIFFKYAETLSMPSILFCMHMS